MAFCVFGDALGVRLPSHDAADLCAAGMAIAFRPVGRPPMAEWVDLPAGTDLAVILPTLHRAIRFARGDGA